MLVDVTLSLYLYFGPITPQHSNHYSECWPPDPAFQERLLVMPASTPNRPSSSRRAAFPAVLLLFASLADPSLCSITTAQSPDSSFLAITPSAATIALTEEASFSAIDST